MYNAFQNTFLKDFLMQIVHQLAVGEKRQHERASGTFVSKAKMY